jgi:Fe-S cluster assembly protein SufD
MTGSSEGDRVLGIAERAPAAIEWVDRRAIAERLLNTLATPVHRESLRHTTFDAVLRLFEDVAATAAVDAAFTGVAQAGVTASPLPQDAAALGRQLADHLPEPARHAGADLALLAAPNGRLITVSDTPAAPLRIEDIGQGAAVTVMRVERGVAVDLIERVAPSGPRGSLLIVELAQNATLNHYRAVAPGATALWLGTSVLVAKGASYRANLIARGRTRARLETHVVLAEPQSRVDLTGASVVTDGEHLDQPVVIEHRAPDTTSTQRFHSIGAGKGRSSFNGRIHIHAGAVRSDAWLGNRNLALHPEAEINTKPELEIYTDDVRCAHGATIGQLDAEALFLMQARGIPEAAARRLLAHAFLRACIAEPLETEGQELIGALPE